MAKTKFSFNISLGLRHHPCVLDFQSTIGFGWEPWHLDCDYHFYISDDKMHDNLFLQHCFGIHMQILQSHNYPMPMEHIVFSYGYFSQFKSERYVFMFHVICH
jgi:hypothetical protein